MQIFKDLHPFSVKTGLIRKDPDRKREIQTPFCLIVSRMESISLSDIVFTGE